MATCRQYPSGLEYVVEHEKPEDGVFLIKKQLKKHPSEVKGSQLAVEPLAYYYVLRLKVFQAPSLHQVLTARLQRFTARLQEGFAKLKHDLDPIEDFRIRQEIRQQAEQRAQEQGSVLSEKAAAPPVTLPSAAEVERLRKTDVVLQNIMNMYPLPQMPPGYFEALQGAAAAVPSQAATQPDEVAVPPI